MHIQASLKVLPTMSTRTETYDKVNEVIEMIAGSGLKYVYGASETTVEGDYDLIFDLVREIHNKLVADEVRQITMIIITDYNDDAQYIDEKLDNVEKYLNKE